MDSSGEAAAFIQLSRIMTNYQGLHADVRDYIRISSRCINQLNERYDGQDRELRELQSRVDSMEAHIARLQGTTERTNHSHRSRSRSRSRN